MNTNRDNIFDENNIYNTTQTKKSFIEKEEFLTSLLNQVKCDKLKNYCLSLLSDVTVESFLEETYENRVAFQNKNDLDSLEIKIKNVFYKKEDNWFEGLIKHLPEKEAHQLLGKFYYKISLKKSYNHYKAAGLGESKLHRDLLVYAKICSDLGKNDEANEIFRKLHNLNRPQEKESTYLEKDNSKIPIYDELLERWVDEGIVEIDYDDEDYDDEEFEDLDDEN